VFGQVIIASLCKFWLVALTVCIYALFSVSIATTRPHLTIAEVLAMTEEDLRIECLKLEIPAGGLHRSAIQRQLLGHLVARATSTPASQELTLLPPAYAAVETDPLGPEREGHNPEDNNLEESNHEEEDREEKDHDLQDTLYSPARQGDSILHPRGVQNVDSADQSSGIIRFRQDRPRQPQTKPPAQSSPMPQYSDVSDIQLQFRRLELDHAREEREREREERERQRDREER